VLDTRKRRLPLVYFFWFSRAVEMSKKEQCFDLLVSEIAQLLCLGMRWVLMASPIDSYRVAWHWILLQ
jgi:hypothetical protein